MDPVTVIKQKNEEVGLSFEKKDHKYFLKSGIELESVTTRLKQFFPFDTEKIAKHLSETTGESPETIIQGWTKVTEAGTKIHELAEKVCNGDELLAHEIEQVKHVVSFLADHPQYKVLGTEIKVCSEKYKIAGTIDVLLLNTDTGKLYLLDWKTSKKEIESHEYFEMASGILKDIPHNKFHRYSMQLAVYSAMLYEEYGIEIYDSMIVHLRDDQTYRVIEATDLLVFAQDVLRFTGE